MKMRYLALAMGVVLAGCSGDNPTFPIRPGGGGTTPPAVLQPTPDTVVTPSAVDNPQRDARRVDITIPTLPAGTTWTRYQVCESAASCTTPIFEDPGSGDTLSFTIGENGPSLEQVLRMTRIGAAPQIRLFNGTDTNPVATMIFGDTQNSAIRLAINNTIQYFKSGLSEANDVFGQTVSISQDGKTIAIGSSVSDTTTTNTKGANKSGAVFIFTDVPPTPAQGNTPATLGGWEQTAILKFSATDTDNVVGDQFGRTVSLSDDGRTLAVAMPGDDTAGTGPTNGTGVPTGTAVTDSGAALIYVKDATGNGWTRQAFLKAPTATANLGFSGGTVSLSGDGNTVAITSNGTAATTEQFNGITIFTRTGTTWAMLGTTNLVPAGIAADGTDMVGRGQGTIALSTTGDRLAVAASGNDSGSDTDPALATAADSGAVYVFNRTGAFGQPYDTGTYLKAAHRSDTGTSTAAIAANQFFGRSLDLSANGLVLAVGSGSDPATNNAITSAETVFIYDFVAGTGNNPGSWIPRFTQANRITPTQTSTDGTGFGRFVKLDDSGANMAVYTINAKRAPGVTDVDATGNVVVDTPTARGTGSITLYTLSGVTDTAAATATVKFHLQPSRPVGNENYRQFGHWMDLSGGGTSPLVFVGGTPLEDSSARGINMENDNSQAVSSGAAWVLSID